MKNKYFFVLCMLAVIMLAGVGFTEIYVNSERNGPQAEEFHVITSFYPMYTAAQNIIADCRGVTLQNLSEPQSGCMHDYQLTTEDMKKLSTADVFIVNGGGIESFLSKVAQQYPKLKIINACERIDLLEDNAHAWMSIPDYMVQIQTIADGLAAADPAHKTVYQGHCVDYLAKLNRLWQKQQDIAQHAAAQGVVIFHEAFAYTARDFGLPVCGSMDLDEERQVSAGEVADVVGWLKENGVRLILAEELYGREMCETVQKEMDVTALYLDTCVRGTYEADSYIRAMEANLDAMQQALTAGDAASAETGGQHA